MTGRKAYLSRQHLAILDKCREPPPPTVLRHGVDRLLRRLIEVHRDPRYDIATTSKTA